MEVFEKSALAIALMTGFIGNASAASFFYEYSTLIGFSDQKGYTLRDENNWVKTSLTSPYAHIAISDTANGIDISFALSGVVLNPDSDIEFVSRISFEPVRALIYLDRYDFISDDVTIYGFGEAFWISDGVWDSVHLSPSVPNPSPYEYWDYKLKGTASFQLSIVDLPAGFTAKDLQPRYLVISDHLNERNLSYIIPTPVPEPSAYAMLGLGLGFLGVVARRRKSV